MGLRRAARQLAKLADEMRLVGVATVGGCLSSARRAVNRSEHLQRVLKACDPRQPLRRDPHQRMKAAFEMTAGQADVARQAVD